MHILTSIDDATLDGEDVIDYATQKKKKRCYRLFSSRDREHS